MSSCITHPNFLVYVKPLMSPVGDCRVCFSLGWGSQKREHDRTVLLKCGTSTICLGDYCGNFKLSNFPNLKVERSENLQQTLDLYSMVEPTIACKMWINFTMTDQTRVRKYPCYRNYKSATPRIRNFNVPRIRTFASGTNWTVRIRTPPRAHQKLRSLHWARSQFGVRVLGL